jgi:class 3 adenylate cyclase/predicted ATPase
MVLRTSTLPPPEAERRHLTVLFCDLVGSTVLAGRLDPEDYREVVRAYHQVCAEVLQRFDGYLAQYLGDGILGYFGYPVAHEDDAQRAVRAGLALLDACASLSAHSALPAGDQVAVRLGVHTGLVVVGDVGAGARHEPLALGETPNIAARLQHLAAPNTLVISAATQQLIAGYFRCQALGAHTLPGLAQPMEVYRVLGPSGAQSRLEVAAIHGLTPLVGREQEMGLLRACWTRVTEGMGQVVLLGGEAGIGKSRLVQVLKAHVASAGSPWLECQGSPYYQHTALYPLTELLAQRLLQVAPEATAAQQVQHLEAFVAQHRLSPAATVPLLASLLSLPLPATYAPVQGSPEQQRQQTLHALLRLLLCLATEQPLLLVIEDLHWVDPSTLEWLGLLVDQGPTARILTLGTYRPDFYPPWTGRSHCTQMTLARLPQRQAIELTHHVAQGKALPAEVVAQIVAKTDGVPLFVEELTKTVLESGLFQEPEEHYGLLGPLPPLAIPGTLHDALLARLDRLGAAKGLAQLGATLGREFSYALLQAVAPWDEATLRRELQQLVEAELLFQRGLPPQATYVFKHALIQDTAYQSLLKRTRQHYHQRIAQTLAAQFPETTATQPELLAHHYTAAGCPGHALPYWYAAGQRAMAHSAYTEAHQYLTIGLEVLATMPETAARHQHELDLLTALNVVLSVTTSPTAPAQERVLTRAATLSQQVGTPLQQFALLQRLFWFHQRRGAYPAAQAVAAQLLDLAHQQQDPALLLSAHHMMGWLLGHIGTLAPARTHLEQGIALAASQGHATPHTTPGGNRDDRVSCRAMVAVVLWELGYPEQAAQRCHEALALAHALGHPYSLANTLLTSVFLHAFRREWQTVQAHSEAALALATEHGFRRYGVCAALARGMALTMQGQGAPDLVQMRQGVAALKAMESGAIIPRVLAWLAAAYEQVGQVDEALHLVMEALARVDTSGGRRDAAQLHWLHGALLLRQPLPETLAAEACFQQALNVARHQQAKAWELRAAMSLARIWQDQGKRAEAYKLLTPIYGWFTEGFNTVDLQEAKALLEALA